MEWVEIQSVVAEGAWCTKSVGVGLCVQTRHDVVKVSGNGPPLLRECCCPKRRCSSSVAVHMQAWSFRLSYPEYDVFLPFTVSVAIPFLSREYGLVAFQESGVMPIRRCVPKPVG